MCTPSLRELRKRFPEARIDFIVEPPAAMAVRGNPNANIVITDRRDGALEPIRLVNSLRGKRYDLAIDFVCNNFSALISATCGARYTLSFAGKRRSFLYTHAVEPVGEYSAANKLSLLRILGIENADPKPEFFVSDKGAGRIGEWIEKVGLRGKRFVVVDATHRRPTRKYTRYSDVAGMIASRLGLPCVFVWGPGEEEEVKSIAAACKQGALVAPRTNLDELGALLSRAALLIGNDSAPRHVATALGTPTLVPTGSTRPENWTLPSPIHRTIHFDIECRPCSSNKCKRGEIECMTRLQPERVFDAAAEMLP